MEVSLISELIITSLFLGALLLISFLLKRWKRALSPGDKALADIRMQRINGDKVLLDIALNDTRYLILESSKGLVLLDKTNTEDNKTEFEDGA